MDIPNIKCLEDIALSLVVAVVNKATEQLGTRKNLFEFAHSCENMGMGKPLVSLRSLKTPLAITSEKIIKGAIDKTWRLNETFSYCIKYLGESSDECSEYYYHEVIFSQPTVAFPIPQVTASVFFRVEDKHTDDAMPKITFRVEGHRRDYDVRRVMLIKDWILETMMMKIKFFMRVEELKMF